MRQWHDSSLFCHDLPTNPQPEIGKVLVTGATGYIGGRLVTELLARGYRVRAMVRDAFPDYAARWPAVEIVVADVLDPTSLRKAMRGVHTAYYLICTSALWSNDGEPPDVQAAVNFRKAAEENGVRRIINLAELGDFDRSLSTHLRSRREVARELMQGRVPTTVLRAGIIIGSGSAPYEILKHLASSSGILLLPRWARNRLQPIAVRDVIKYLVGVLESPETQDRSFEIGGSDVLTGEMMIKVMARLLGKRRFVVFVPFTNVGSIAYLLSLLTPVPAPIARCLIEDLRPTRSVARTESSGTVPFQPMNYEQAIRKAMAREEHDNVPTRWSDAYPPAHSLAIKLHQLEPPPRYAMPYSLVTKKSVSALFQSVCKIGGQTGWFRSNWLWELRGAVDRILMGVGTSRGRRSSTTLRIDDVVDFWRVEDLRHGERLLLRAEMKLPGRAWLEFRIDPGTDANRLSLKAYYEPRGAFGKLYWYAMLPFHAFIFPDLIRQIESRGHVDTLVHA